MRLRLRLCFTSITCGELIEHTTPEHCLRAGQCTCLELRGWLAQRWASYKTTIGSTWDQALLSYAAARDAACWQLNRPEPTVWSLLEGIGSCYQDLKAHPWPTQG